MAIVANLECQEDQIMLMASFTSATDLLLCLLYNATSVATITFTSTITTMIPIAIPTTIPITITILSRISR